MKMQPAFTVILTSALLSGIAHSQPSDPGFHAHDGFYLSLCGGFGGLTWADDEPPVTSEMSGATGNLDFKIGGAVMRDRLILSGDLITAHAPNPKEKGNSAPVANNASLRMGIIGMGATYYFMPVNIFLSGTFGIGRFTEDFGNGQQTSDGGLGFQLKVGKEWWVSKDWGIGVSVALLHLGVPDQSNADGPGGSHLSESLGANALGILFNSSFN